VKSWTSPVLPFLPGAGIAPALHDEGRRAVTVAGGHARLYVCGITPYDATHLGHAATYLAFDTLVRAWLDAGLEVSYAQNVTDVDDPLLERATATGVDWRDLAASQIELFRRDMQALGIVAPQHFVAVTEVIEPVAAAVSLLLRCGLAYGVGDDIYFDSAAAASDTWSLGDVSSLSRRAMQALSLERGGDAHPAKRDVLDPLLWRAARPGEPSWPSAHGDGRPGWHVECAVIAQEFVGVPLSVNGGGSDLTFPHHEFSAGHTAALTGKPLAAVHAHSGMVAFEGEKMSKSLGNLVRVSELIEGGADPRAIRLALLAHHYRSDWEWHADQLEFATARLEAWSAWARDVGEGQALLGELRRSIAADLDTPAAIAAIDALVAAELAPSRVEVDAIEALLGIRL
jgi:L-cysteine:1D-myo-inositol 2-amino-2-deoxy-alpha-D-glucopyranoside ligase